MEAFATAVWPENPVEATGGSGAHLLRRSVGSTEAPTEVSQPTARRVAQPPVPRKRRWPLALVSALVLLGGGAAALTLTPPGRRWLERTGLAAPVAAETTADSAAAPDSMPALAQQPPAPADATRPDTGRTTPPETPTRRAEPPRQTPPVTTAPAPVRMGELSIVATPDGMVLIDGVERGDSPGRWELPAGRHVVQVRKEGWHTWVDTVEITAGNSTRRSAVLRRVDQ
jgi:hypothetical protein